MNSRMALALSPPIQIPSITTDYLSTLNSSGNGIPVRSVSSPGGTRRTVPAGQQFGRYQQPSDSNSNNINTTSKSSSSLSLEALAAFLSSSPEETYFDLSPPARSRGFHSYRPKEHERVRKSQSFPIVKPTQSSANHHNKRPPIRKARSVKFADSEGLPLASVRKLTSADPFQTEGAIVPKLLSDLGALSLKNDIPACVKRSIGGTSKAAPVRKLHFSQPGTQPDFYNKLKTQLVGLESVSASQPRAIHGIVKVMNIAYDKEVSVRWTHDKWRTHHDSKCSYCQGSSDGVTDRFSFTLPANGDDIEFAVCYRVNGAEYWDSFNGQNYLITVEN